MPDFRKRCLTYKSLKTCDIFFLDFLQYVKPFTALFTSLNSIFNAQILHTFRLYLMDTDTVFVSCFFSSLWKNKMLTSVDVSVSSAYHSNH